VIVVSHLKPAKDGPEQELFKVCYICRITAPNSVLG